MKITKEERRCCMCDRSKFASIREIKGQCTKRDLAINYDDNASNCTDFLPNNTDAASVA